ncbi:thiosulfate sulfurtransferase/rhodanese-like domain-containing protein 1 [Trichomycterus rosablanca]|uniref:thiosulfate sulfurtransferase/rhodanese-like domain-containing protein 1 n=1 Tax=Trichomycterus rosablanca TaxID=2290929 RepID=UPI002F353235
MFLHTALVYSVLGLLGSVCSYGPSNIQNTENLYTEVTDTVCYDQLKQMFVAGKLQLFDVRELHEFEEGAIPGAINIPLSKLQQAFTLTPDQFTQQFGVRMPETQDADVILYCQRGRRSLSALHTLYSLGYKRVRHYLGGFSEWLRFETQ